MPLRLGDHTFPAFTGADVAFGADDRAYPALDTIPEPYRGMRGKGCAVASALFYRGGQLSDHGIELKPGVDEGEFYAALRALLSSWAPQHEVKIGTCGWLIDEHTQPITINAAT